MIQKMFENDMFKGDIQKIIPEDMPDFDVLCADFHVNPFLKLI